MAWVPFREGAEKESYYRFLREIDPVPQKIKEMIFHAKGKTEDALELEDRTLITNEKRFPEKDGYYPLREGGVLVATNIKIPDITGEMIAWWAYWHSLDPLRYALWDPEDHFDVQIDDVGRSRAENPDLPAEEKLWYATHRVSEAFDRDEPQDLILMFQNPGEMGYDLSLMGTKRCEYILCAKSLMNGKIPVFLTENFTSAGGEMEVRLRYWMGYDLVFGKVQCMIPPSVQIPEHVLQMLMIHNYKEYIHLNKVLPAIYEAEKEN